MLFSQLAQLYRVLEVQRLRPGLVEWGSRKLIWLRTAPYSCSFLILLFSFWVPQSWAQSPSLDVNTTTSTDGYYVLSWDISGESSSQAQEFTLEESPSQDFSSASLIYSGPDKSRVISGKPDGSYFYRVSLSDDSAASSDVIAVEVAHHSIQRALFFFVLGFVVFGSILFTVLRGAPEEDGAAG